MTRHLGIFILGLLLAFGLMGLFSDYGESAEAARQKSEAHSKKAEAKIHNRKVSSGDTIYDILRRNGFSDTQRNLALSQSPIPRAFTLAPGDVYQVVKAASDHRIEINFFDRFANMAYTFWKDPEQVGADIKENILRTEVTTISGKVKGSLIESIRKLVGDEMLAYRFIDAYVLDYNLPKQLQRGAKFRIEFEKLYSGSQFIRVGEVLRAELEVGEKNVIRQFQPTKSGGVFIGAKDNHSSRPFYSPVDYIRISSLYQPRRFHPVKKRYIAHLGIDFELPEGENIYAMQSGVILRSGRNRAAGKYVVIKHSNGYESYYNHLSEISKSIYPGLHVNTGTIIGQIGCTGYCTKPHLHLAVKKNGRFVNPINLIKRYAFHQRDVGIRLVKN